MLSLLVGWPAITVTVVLALVGLLRNDYRFLVAAAILAFPFSWYLSGFPAIRSPAFLLSVFILGSGYMMYRKREMLAWLLALPFFLTVLLLLYVVVSQ